MKLFTKEINDKLFKQYPKGAELENQNVICKIFNPYGRGRWFLMNSDPSDPDYLWAIVEMGGEVEMGSVSRRELESIRVSPWKFPLERDLSFSPKNALEIWNGLRQGKHFAEGGHVSEENKEMLENQSVEIKHHSEELQDVLKKTDVVEPWIIAKTERASNDLADVTHYLDGESKKMADGGMMAKGGVIYFDEILPAEKLNELLKSTFNLKQGKLRQNEMVENPTRSSNFYETILFYPIINDETLAEINIDIEQPLSKNYYKVSIYKTMGMKGRYLSSIIPEKLYEFYIQRINFSEFEKGFKSAIEKSGTYDFKSDSFIKSDKMADGGKLANGKYKYEKGDEGMFMGDEVRVVKLNVGYGIYEFDIIDEDGKVKSHGAAKMEKFEKQFRYFPKMADGGYMAKGGDIWEGSIRRIDGVDYLFSQAVQDSNGNYSGWATYKVVYDTHEGEKHINYERTKKHYNYKYFRNNNVGKDVGSEYFADGGYMAKGGEIKEGDYFVSLRDKSYRFKIRDIDGNRVTIESIKKDGTNVTDYGEEKDNLQYLLEKGYIKKVTKKEYWDGNSKMADGGETEEGVDLFEDYDDIPANVKKVLDRHSEAFEYGDYSDLEKANKALQKVGYTFEYGLDGQAYDLRKIGQKGKSETMADGGYMAKGGNVELTNKDVLEKGKIKYYEKEFSVDANRSADGVAFTMYNFLVEYKGKMYEVNSAAVNKYGQIKVDRVNLAFPMSESALESRLGKDVGGMQMHWVSDYRFKPLKDKKELMQFGVETMADGGYMAKGGSLDSKLKKYAKEDVNLLEKEGGMAITDTKLGVIFGEHKNGFFTFTDRNGKTLFSGNKEQTIDFVKSNYQVEGMSEGGFMSKGGMVTSVSDANKIKPELFYKYEYKSKNDGEWKDLKKTDSPLSLYKSGYEIRLKERYQYILSKGGMTFEGKVKSVKKRLLEGKKVSPKVQKDYGKTYSPKEAEESAKRIVGAMTARERMKYKMKK